MANNDKVVRKEVIGLILFFCSLILMLIFYLPSNFTGIVGSFFKSLGLGTMGVAGFSIPVFLLYAAIDCFFEKSTRVSRLRVTSVILIMICVSSLFAAFTMDFEYFRSICVAKPDKAESYSAIKALSLLYQSGVEPSLISNPVNSINVLPGGLLGGIVAVSINAVCDTLLTQIVLIAFTVTQIVVIFNISVKKTATDIYKAGKKQIENQKLRGKPSSYRNDSQIGAVNIGSSDISVQEVPVFDGNAIPNPRSSYDPFNVTAPTIPVDSSGFISIDAQESNTNQDYPDSLLYVDKKVQINPSDNNADFSYTSRPMNVPIVGDSKNNVELSFLSKDTEQDFYNLDDTVDSSVNQTNNFDDYDEGPIEIVGNSDDAYDTDENVGTGVRTPYIPTNIFDYGNVRSNGVIDSTDDIHDVSVTDRADIRINAKADVEACSNTEGRVFDMNSQRTTESNEYSAADRRVGRRIIKRLPSSAILDKDSKRENPNSDTSLRSKAVRLEEALFSFGIKAKVINITHGPAITRFELTIPPGVKVSRVLSLSDDIQLAMAATSVRIEAPIPGKSAIGIEIPNDTTTAVHLGNLIEHRAFREAKPLTVVLGRDIPGKGIYCDLTKMPHLLIAGSTGSGKSVCINSILISILYKSMPEDVRLILIDPKVVELSVYNGIPHLLLPVVTDPKKATGTLRWAVNEMTRRYNCFAETHVRDINGYNERMLASGQPKMPLILLIIDELADLMTVASKEVEEQIMRLAAMARAAGIHMILATQRPSVDVITGVLKNNMPSRIAFAVTSGVDSRTILDSVGAEKLLGKGDMLYAPQSAPKPIRGQGAFVSDTEVENVINHWRQYGTLYDERVIEQIENNAVASSASDSRNSSSDSESDGDDLFEQAVEIVIDAKVASVSILQRRLGIGYPRAARLIDSMEESHYIGPFEGSKPRKVLINKTDWLEIKAKKK